MSEMTSMGHQFPSNEPVTRMHVRHGMVKLQLPGYRWIFSSNL